MNKHDLWELEMSIGNICHSLKNMIDNDLRCEDKRWTEVSGDKIYTHFHDLINDNFIKIEELLLLHKELSNKIISAGFGCIENEPALANDHYDRYMPFFSQPLDEKIDIQKIYDSERAMNVVRLWITYSNTFYREILQELFTVPNVKINIEAIEKLRKTVAKNVATFVKEYFLKSKKETVIQSSSQKSVEENVDDSLPEVEKKSSLESYSTNDLIIEAGAFSFSSDEGNKSQFSGILFPIEEVSDDAPSKGSSLPLYVPMEVARLVADSINNSEGLPLDADNTLSRHNDKGIVGIMTKAQIIANNLVVSGHLFPYNNPELVAEIKAMKHELGMSINAIARGINDFIDGKEVFVLKELKPLGANILKAVRATWAKTAVLQAEAQKIFTEEVEDDVEFDAYLEDYLENYNEKFIIDKVDDSSNDENLKTDKKVKNEIDYSDSIENIESLSIKCQNQEDITSMNNEKLESFLNLFNTKLDNLVQGSEDEFNLINDRLNEFNEQVRIMASKVESIENEKKQMEQQKELQAAKQQESNLIETISDRVAEKFFSVINPQGQPPRKTAPLIQAGASSASQKDQGLSEQQATLIAAEARLKVMEEMGEVGANRLAAIEEITAIKRQMGIY